MDRAYVDWVDTNGNTRLTWYTFAAGGILAPFATALDNLANPTPLTVVAASLQAPGGAPSTNPYLSVMDSAVLTFSTGAGTSVGVLVPGFKEALYLADNQTVDPAQPLVIAFVAQALGLPLVDSSNNPVTTFVGGLRQRRGF